MYKIKGLDFLIVFNCISIILLLLLIPERLESFSSELNLNYCLISILNIILFFIVMKGYFNTWIRYDVFFLLGYLILHFQIPFMESLGIEINQPDYVFVNKRVVNYATWLSTMVLLFWLLGFVLFLKKSKKLRMQNQSTFQKIPVIKLDYLLVFFLFLFLVTVGNDFLSGAYNGTVNWGTGAAYVFIVLQAILYLRIIYFFINSSHIKSPQKIISQLFQNKIFVFILCLYFLMFFLIGDRGPIMQVCILIISSYSIFIKKTSLKVLLLVVLVGSFLFTLIRMGRTSDVTNVQGKNIIERGIENLSTSDESFNPTEELASSVRILYRALDLVPERHPYLYGTTILFDVTAIIPFGASTFVSLTDLPLMYQSSPNFFTIIGQGSFFTYGEGSEIIADLYINFGIYGVIITIFFFGYFISYLSVSAILKKRSKAIIVFLILSATAVYINRANFLMPLRDVIFPLIINVFLVRTSSIFKGSI